MKKSVGFVSAVIVTVIMVYAASGYVSAAIHSAELKQRAKTLIDTGKGAATLGEDRLQLLLLVQDPAFYHHDGVDTKTAGAGLTTVTQSVSKRLAFSEFKPGIGKIRQTAYAIALERRLTKNEILALFLETVPMGKGPDGWTVGFFEASEGFYGSPPHELSDSQFIELVSVMIAPSLLNHMNRDKNFTERLNRINRLYNGECLPKNNKDVWFDGCAT